MPRKSYRDFLFRDANVLRGHVSEKLLDCLRGNGRLREILRRCCDVRVSECLLRVLDAKGLRVARAEGLAEAMQSEMLRVLRTVGGFESANLTTRQTDPVVRQIVAPALKGFLPT
jgi:hypothetical protein